MTNETLDNEKGATSPSQPPPKEELYLPPAWALHGINAVMVGSACVAMAITKQLVLPRSAFRVPEVYASMPAWYTERYRAALVWRGALKQVLRDSATLMASCAAWWGLETVLDKVRPADDHINGYVGGMVGGAIVGQRFFPPAPHAAMRTFACAAIGGLSGWYSSSQQAAIRSRLLVKQQELERRFLHGGTPDAPVSQTYEPDTLYRLLRMEHLEAVKKVRAQGAAASGGGGGSAPGGAKPGTSEQQPHDANAEWQELLAAAPWLPSKEPPQLPPAGGDSIKQPGSSSSSSSDGGGSVREAAPQKKWWWQ